MRYNLWKEKLTTFKLKNMIQAQELRIGNYVTHRHFPYDNFTIRSISKDRIHMINIVDKDGYGVDYNLSDLHPIPLSPDILIKAGFKKSITGTCYGMITGGGKSRFSIFSDGRFMVETTNIEVEIKYVHQLQNLVHALTGTELTINL